MKTATHVYYPYLKKQNKTTHLPPHKKRKKRKEEKKKIFFFFRKTKAVTGNISLDPHPSHEHTRHMENISSKLNKVTQSKLLGFQEKKKGKSTAWCKTVHLHMHKFKSSKSAVTSNKNKVGGWRVEGGREGGINQNEVWVWWAG